VFDDLALLEPEDIHDRPPPRSGLSHAMGVDNHIIPFGKHPFDLEVGLGKFVAQEAQEALEPLDILGPVARRSRIVVDEPRPKIDQGRFEVLTVEGLLAEFDGTPWSESSGTDIAAGWY
jgi:hypothetical protein